MSVLEIEHCPSCFIEYAVPKALLAKKLSDGGDWWCPNGHRISYTESAADKLRKERDKLKREKEAAEAAAARENRWRCEAVEEAAAAQRQLRAQKGVTTRLKKRIAHGVCPCCNRQFQDLTRHMASKHPAFLEEEAPHQGETLQ